MIKYWSAYAAVLVLLAAVPSAVQAANASSSELKYDLLAENFLLEEFEKESQRLSMESSYANTDANNLWTQVSGIPTRSPTGVSRLQPEAFSLKSRADNLLDEAKAFSADVAKVHGQWRELADRIQNGKGTKAKQSQTIVDIREAMRPLAQREATLDTNIRYRQGDIDHLFPEVERKMRRAANGASSLTKPWHWDYYMGSGRGRPDLQSDFESRYSAAMDQAREQLDSPKPRQSNPKK